MNQPTPSPSRILTCGDLPEASLVSLLKRYGLAVGRVGADQEIPGSYWGPPEAGLRGAKLFVRDDTPVHSALHEACHFVCMDGERRRRLDTDAEGEEVEECAVCYLQILLAPYLPGVTRQRMMTDLDSWGYSFRLGSARSWFEEDADDARQWLLRHGLIDEKDRPTFRLRR